MANLIDKDALVAEIKRHIKEEPHSYFCKCLLSEIDTLEVKEVDLKKEIEFEYNPVDGLSFEEFARIAKHFYSLGLAQKGEKI